MAAHPPVDVHATVAAHGGAAAHGGEAGGFPPFDPNLFASQLVWFVITFGALYFVLSRLVLPAISSVLAKRAGTIKGDLDEAAQKSAAADEARVSMERAVAKARGDARTMIDAARAEVQAKLNTEQEAADQRLADRIEAAEAKINTARRQALGEVGGIAETLARDIADRIAPASAPARTPVAANGGV